MECQMIVELLFLAMLVIPAGISAWVAALGFAKYVWESSRKSGNHVASGPRRVSR